MAIVEKQGLAALTYESLAAESGLSKSGLIYYFPSRQTLLLEINRFLAAQWEEKMVELAGGPAHEVGEWERIRASFLVMSQSATLADLRMTLDAADEGCGGAADDPQVDGGVGGLFDYHDQAHHGRHGPKR